MSKKPIERVFEAEVDVNGTKQKTKFRLKEISAQDQREAQKIYNKVFKDAVDSGAFFKKEMDTVLKQRGLWNDEIQKQLEEKQAALRAEEKKILEGGIALGEAKKVALKIREMRGDIAIFVSPRTDYLTNTAEGQADNARFNYLVSATLVYDSNNKPYFTSYEDYLNRSTDPVGFEAASRLASIQWDLDPDFDKKFPENKFLNEFGFTNEDGHLIREDGKLVDLEGRLINNEGYYVNEAGERVNKDGIRVNDDGTPIIERKPFLNDDGSEAKPKTKVVQEEAKDSGVTG